MQPLQDVESAMKPDSPSSRTHRGASFQPFREATFIQGSVGGLIVMTLALPLALAGGQGHRGRCRTRSDVREASGAPAAPRLCEPGHAELDATSVAVQVLRFMEGAEVQEEEEDEAASPTSPSEARA